MLNSNTPPVMGTVYQIAADDLAALIYDACRQALQEARPPQEQTPAPEWGSRHDAAVLVGVSLPTIHALISQGLIEAQKCGRRTLINLGDLRAKLASGALSKYRKPQK